MNIAPQLGLIDAITIAHDNRSHAALPTAQLEPHRVHPRREYPLSRSVTDCQVHLRPAAGESSAVAAIAPSIAMTVTSPGLASAPGFLRGSLHLHSPATDVRRGISQLPPKSS